jgi:D-alanine-D-alanine ligase
MQNGTLECSAIERPLKDTSTSDEMLSFADKYQKGGGKKSSKTSGDAAAGMASLSREVPARISVELKNRIEDSAKRAYSACRLAGSPRIDFMYVPATDELYLTEINPIPGSLAFYLWEALGIPFQAQISDALEQAVVEQKSTESKRFDYTTDIVDTFCS